MGAFISGFNPIVSILITIRNFPYYVDNMKSKRNFRRKKLSYNDILRVEYDCVETPEFIFENMCVDKNIEDENNFNQLINVLKKNKILKWKKNYIANFEYCDGPDWNIKITFNSGDLFETGGGIIFPRRFKFVYKEFEKYMLTSDNEELNKIIIDKWFIKK